ncbi:hypothetical protein PMAYCL1PPCAC_31356, partial [Pristionchus mayeri]
NLFVLQYDDQKVAEFEVVLSYEYNMPGMEWDPSEFGGLEQTGSLNIWSSEMEPCNCRMHWRQHSKEPIFARHDGKAVSALTYFVNISRDGSDYIEQAFPICLQIKSLFDYPRHLNIQIMEGKLPAGVLLHLDSQERVQSRMRGWKMSDNISFTHEDEEQFNLNVQKANAIVHASKQWMFISKTHYQIAYLLLIVGSYALFSTIIHIFSTSLCP